MTESAVRPWRRRALLVGVFVVASAGWLVFANGVIGDPHVAEPFTWSVEADRSGLAADNTLALGDGSSLRLVDGSVGVFTATLLPCEHEHGWRSWFGTGWFGAGIAAAGHGDGEDTTARGPTVIDLTSDSPVEVGTATTIEPDYCQAHAAFAASSAAERLAGAAEPTLSLNVEHTSVGGTSTSYVMSTTSPGGGSVEIDALEVADNAILRINVANVLNVVADQIAAGETAPNTLSATALTSLALSMDVVTR